MSYICNNAIQNLHPPDILVIYLYGNEECMIVAISQLHFSSSWANISFTTIIPKLLWGFVAYK